MIFHSYIIRFLAHNKFISHFLFYSLSAYGEIYQTGPCLVYCEGGRDLRVVD